MSTTNLTQPPLPLPELDDLLSLADVARLAGVTYSTIKMYHYRRECHFPKPDTTVPSKRGGPDRIRWFRSTAEAWIASRPGSGHYDRSTAQRSERTPETKPRERGPKARCPVCKLPVEVTVLRQTFRMHGPFKQRCRGGGQPLSAWPGVTVEPASVMP